jgi:hypothetical protein
LWAPVVIVLLLTGLGTLWLYIESGKCLYQFLFDWQSGISALLGLGIIALVETVRVAAELIRHRQAAYNDYATLAQFAIIAAETLKEQASLRVFDLEGLIEDAKAEPKPIVVEAYRLAALQLNEPTDLYSATAKLATASFEAHQQMAEVMRTWRQYNRSINIRFRPGQAVTDSVLERARDMADELGKAAERYAATCRQQRDEWRPPVSSFRWFRLRQRVKKLLS